MSGWFESVFQPVLNCCINPTPIAPEQEKQSQAPASGLKKLLSAFQSKCCKHLGGTRWDLRALTQTSPTSS